MQQYMDLLSSRQKLVASNIANVDTPGYKTKDIDFQFEYMSLAPGANPNVVEARPHRQSRHGSRRRRKRRLGPAPCSQLSVAAPARGSAW